MGFDELEDGIDFKAVEALGQFVAQGGVAGQAGGQVLADRGEIADHGGIVKKLEASDGLFGRWGVGSRWRMSFL